MKKRLIDLLTVNIWILIGQHREKILTIKMQILKPAHEYLLIIGLSAHQSIQKYPFNTRNGIILFVLCLNSACYVGFLLSGTEDIMKFIDAFYTAVTVILGSFMFINWLWKMRQLFELIEKLEDTVDQSKM